MSGKQIKRMKIVCKRMMRHRGVDGKPRFWSINRCEKMKKREENKWEEGESKTNPEILARGNKRAMRMDESADGADLEGGVSPTWCERGFFLLPSFFLPSSFLSSFLLWSVGPAFRGKLILAPSTVGSGADVAPPSDPASAVPPLRSHAGPKEKTQEELG